MGKSFLTPVARFVLGDIYDPQTKDAENQALVIKTGPNAGQPGVRYFIAIAIPKTDPEWAGLWATICEEARTSFPTQFDANGAPLNPQFAFKVIDGDSTVANAKGVAPVAKIGHAGHMILNFSGTFPPKVYGADSAPINTPGYIKRGYYVRIHGNVAGNGSTQRPGVYLNYEGVQFVAYGDEINVGKSGEEMFGGKAPGPLPVGASSTPLTPAETPPGAQTVPGAAPAPAAGPSVASAPAPTAPAAGPSVASASGSSVPVATVGPAPAALGVAPAPNFLNPTPTFRLDDGSQWTREQLLASGWTNEAIDDLIPF